MRLMKEAKATLLFLIATLCAPFLVFAQGTVTGSQTQGMGEDTRPIEQLCKSNDRLEYKIGDICHYQKVPCQDGSLGYVISRCNMNKDCVAVESCGKPLADKPYEIPDTTPSQPNSPSPMTPNTGGTQNPIPSTPSGSGGASGSGSGGGTGGTSGGIIDNGSGPAELPPIQVVQNPPLSSSGTTFSPSPSYSLNPRAGWSGNGGGAMDDGVYSGGNPFSNTGNTFGGGNWGGSGSAGASTNLFASFVSGLADLFSGFFAGGSAESIARGSSSPAPAAPQPAPRPSVPTQVAGGQFSDMDPTLMTPADFEKLFGPLQSPIDAPLPTNPQNGFPLVPEQPLDRPGLPLTAPSGSLTGGSPPIRLPGSGGIPDWDSEPTMPTAPATNGGRGLVENDTGSQNDASPVLPAHPDWWTPQLENTFAAGIESGLSPDVAADRAQSEFVKGVYAGLADGRLAPDASDVGLARRILQEDVAQVENIRDREYMTHALGFYEWIDKNIYSVTAVQRAVDAANARLDILGNSEAIARLGQYSGSLEPPVTKPFDTSGFVDIFDLRFSPVALTAKGFNKIVAWWSGPAAGATAPAASTPAPEPQSGLLSGLSSMASRVVDATRSVAARLGFGASIPDTVTPPAAPSAPSAPNIAVAPTPSATQPSTPLAQPPVTKPTPAPSMPAPQSPQPPQAPSAPSAPQPSASAQSGGFLQSGINLVSLMLQGLADFFTGSSGSTAQPALPLQPAPVTPAGSITANPPQINSSEQSKLSWSSVGTQGCAVIDGSFDVLVRGGTTGDLISPSLTASARFGLVCDIKGGKDKFVNETLVRVKGDATDPSALFPYSGSVSDAVAQGNVNAPTSTGVSASTGSASSQPNDVRTCDPEQSIDSFIRCLCEAEPNSNGCAIPPGGV